MAGINQKSNEHALIICRIPFGDHVVLKIEEIVTAVFAIDGPEGLIFEKSL